MPTGKCRSSAHRKCRDRQPPPDEAYGRSVGVDTAWLTLYRRNLAPDESEHWWGHFEGADGRVEDERLETDEQALAWARSRAPHVYVSVPHEAEPGRYWAGDGPPPSPDLRPWRGRPVDTAGPTLFEAKRAQWQAQYPKPE